MLAKPIVVDPKGDCCSRCSVFSFERPHVSLRRVSCFAVVHPHLICISGMLCVPLPLPTSDFDAAAEKQVTPELQQVLQTIARTNVFPYALPPVVSPLSPFPVALAGRDAFVQGSPQYFVGSPEL